MGGTLAPILPQRLELRGFDLDLLDNGQLTVVDRILSRVPRLEWARLAGVPIGDDVLAWPSLSSIEYLSLDYTSVNSAGFVRLSRLTRLKQLSIENIDPDAAPTFSVAILQEMPRLEHIRLRGIVVDDSEVTGIKETTLHSLAVLDLSGCTYRRTGDRSVLSGLATGTSLKEIYLCDGVRAADISAIEQCVNVTTLDLSETALSLSDVPWVTRLPKLSSVAISCSTLNAETFAIAMRSPALRTLHVCGASAEDGCIELRCRNPAGAFTDIHVPFASAEEIRIACEETHGTRVFALSRHRPNSERFTSPRGLPAAFRPSSPHRDAAELGGGGVF